MAESKIKNSFGTERLNTQILSVAEQNGEVKAYKVGGMVFMGGFLHVLADAPSGTSMIVIKNVNTSLNNLLCGTGNLCQWRVVNNGNDVLINIDNALGIHTYPTFSICFPCA